MRRLLLLPFLLAAPAVRAAPETSPELSALVPAETLALVECNDLDGKGRFGEETAIGKLLAEPDVRFFLRKLKESLKTAYAGNARDPLAMLGLAPEDFDGIVFRRVGLAIVGVSIDTRQVDAVLYLETRAGGDKVGRILQGLRQAAETFTQVQFTETDVRGRKVVATTVRGHELCVAAQGDRFVLTTRRARMEEVLKAIDEGHPAPLSASPRVTRLKERMGAVRNAIFGYADAPAIGRLVADALRYAGPDVAKEPARIVRALGLDAVDAVAFADVPEGDGFRTEGAVLLKERRGIFALASTTPPSQRFAAMTPPDALVYGAETCDLALLWDGIVKLAGGIDADLGAKLERGAREVGAVLGLDLRKDLLEALGTEWSGYVAWPPGGGLLPDVVLFATVRDRERLVKTLDAIADKAREFRGRGTTVTTTGRTEFRGTEIRFLEMTDKKGEPRPFAPAWAVGEDFVVFGLCPQTVKHALVAKGPAPDAVMLEARGLLGGVGFQRLLAAAPKNAVGVKYIDLGRVMTWLYAAGAPLLQVTQGAINRQLQMVGVRLNFEDLPTADVIARHLSGMLSYMAVDDDCIRVGYVSQIGAPLVAVPVVAFAGLAAVLIPMSQRRAQALARVQAEREAQAAQEAQRVAEAPATGAQEVAKLREENAMLKKRLDELEARVAELLRATEERK